MTVWYPLRFEPIYKQYIWGGHRFVSNLDRRLPIDQSYAESWEVSDHGEDQSVISAGLFKGITLHEMLMIYGPELVGYKAFASLMQNPIYRFPLLLKYLDASENLSLQVHPDDRRAAEHDPPDLGKTEAWIVLDASKGATIYAGLQPGVDRETLEMGIRSGDCLDLLNQFEARVGDTIFIPAGTVHALGKGCLVAEIQQTSDITYRLFDWNRVGVDGKPRPLHIEEGLEVIDFERGPIEPVKQSNFGIDTLVQCEQFAMAYHQLEKPCQIGGGDNFHILTVLEGSLSIEGDPVNEPLTKGQTALLPAGLGEIGLVPEGQTVFLDCTPSTPEPLEQKQLRIQGSFIR
jgi:mannose-6-phosphate isomerase